MNNAAPSTSGCMGGLTLLGVALVTLKLTDYIGWPWWVVTLPFWGGFAALAVMLAVMLVCSVVVRVIFSDK